MELFSAAEPLQIADQGCFFAGGRYVESGGGRTMAGQMYVQYQVPQARRFPYPLVMIHGGGQTGINFLSTPDGRKGWSDYFVSRGYAVYVVDQPGRGRSGYFPGSYGKAVARGTRPIEQRFTASARDPEAPPQAVRHTQWPGKGLAGDPVFDQFYASQVESMEDLPLLESLVREAGSALLDRIGPAVLITHSQSVPLGWSVADARPKLVRGIVAVEPTGGPVHEVLLKGPPDFFKDGALARPWGVTFGPVTYAPAVSSPDELQFIRQDRPETPGLAHCWLQAEPARQLANLKGIPILITVSEASHHASYDHCTSLFLRQAGVENEFVRLADAGLGGNGHMLMLEKNHFEIAAFLQKWIESKTR